MMRLSKKEFDRAKHYLNMGKPASEVAIICNISIRQVRRIKEAETWDNWPYILAKAQFGYMTPEYKIYLKRRGLPITRTGFNTEIKKTPVVYIHIVNKPWWKRLFKVK